MVVEEVDSRVRLVRVYNFSVANAHNYGGDGVLVHNSTGFQWNDGNLGPNDGGIKIKLYMMLLMRLLTELDNLMISLM